MTDEKYPKKLHGEEQATQPGEQHKCCTLMAAKS